MVKPISTFAFVAAVATHLRVNAWPSSPAPAPGLKTYGPVLPRGSGRGGSKHHKPCAPFNRGDFAIEYWQLYPENADWDEEFCQLWIG